MRIARRARRKNIKIARKEKSGAKRGESTDVKGKKLVEKVGEKGGDRVGEKLSLNQRKIIELKKKKASISARELSVLVGISQRKIEVIFFRLFQRVTGAGFRNPVVQTLVEADFKVVFYGRQLQILLRGRVLRSFG